jgi:hypothetical protein
MTALKFYTANRHRIRERLLLAFLLVTLLATVTGEVAFAQGCALCQEAAKAQSAKGAQALNYAIILLLVPPVTIMGGLLIWAFKYRNDPGEQESQIVEKAGLNSRSELLHLPAVRWPEGSLEPGRKEAFPDTSILYSTDTFVGTPRQTSSGKAIS